jgi:hypothetical protein
MLYVGERGTTVPHALHMTVETAVPNGWNTIVAALGEFTGIFLPPTFFAGMLHETTGCLFPCLQRVADALPI